MTIKDKHAVRIEKKFCNLITENPWTIELDRNEYRLQQFKRKAPSLYNSHREKILADIELLRVDVTVWFETNKKQGNKFR
jgi:hypothetical protein